MMRESAKRAFLTRAGWGRATVSSLAGDASNRRYDRVSGEEGRAVLMDAPKERGEDISVFLDFTALLHEQGLSAPAVLAADERREELLRLEKELSRQMAAGQNDVNTTAQLDEVGKWDLEL